MHLICVDLFHMLYNKNVKEELVMFVLLIIVATLILIDYRLVLGMLNVGLGLIIGFSLSVWACLLGFQALIGLI